MLTTGGLAQFLSPGNLTVNGGINLPDTAGSVISGRVHHPFVASYIGPIPGGGFDSTLIFPTLPILPAVTAFPAAGATNITTTSSIVPGSYGNVSLTTNGTIERDFHFYATP